MTTRQVVLNSLVELVLTAALLFGVTTIVRFAIGPSVISRAIPAIHSELASVGTAVALLLTGLILSPLGKISGGHMNPAISFALWRFGCFPVAGVAPYIAAQLLGSVLGVLAARLVWGPVIASPPVTYAVLQPAPTLSESGLFIGEALSMAVIVLVVGVCLAVHRLTPLVPWVVGAMIGLAIALLGTSTGGSVNPAREFGPALASGQVHFLWIYLAAPIAGAELAVWARARFQKRAVLTYRLCGVRSPLSKATERATSPRQA